MQVGLLTHAARGGDAIGRQVAAKVAFFRDRGADVRVVVATDAAQHPGLSPFVCRLPPPNQRDRLIDWLKSCDLVLVEYSQDSPVLELLHEIAGSKPKIIFDYHGVTPPALGNANHRDALVRGESNRGLVWYADAAIVHSRFMHDDLTGATDYPSGRVRQLGYPFELGKFTPGTAQTDLRESLRLPRDARVVLFVGRLAPNKRAPVLVEALAHLPSDVHAVFIGECGDCYESERQRCRETAVRYGVAERIHFAGAVDETGLLDAYRSADLLELPSVHEGFCLPVIEAMACGLPVVAARAAALPETLGDAGLTFEPDDAADLARVVSRVLASKRDVTRTASRRVAIVSERFGDGFAGGAERSQRLLASRMSRAGYAVEVFTLGDRDSFVDGLPVSAFRPDPANRDRLAAARCALSSTNGATDREVETSLITNSPRSAALIEALDDRGPFDAIVVGPYGSGLALQVADRFPTQTLLLPCWHDEPLARLDVFRQTYRAVGGVLYHSKAECRLAESALGLNQPNAHVIGTLLEAQAADAARGREFVGTGRRYLVYAGRYCREKGLHELLAFARRYGEAHPNRFTFAFLGDSGEPITPSDGICDLGYVTNDVRSDVMAGADALVLLSNQESLSLVVLEANALGVPAIVKAGNEVMAAHVARGGGVSVDGYESFAAALDDLWEDPAHWREMGRAACQAVEREFSDADAFDASWQAALARLGVPLIEQMRSNGLRRAAMFESRAWSQEFASVVDAVLDSQSRRGAGTIEIQLRDSIRSAACGAGETAASVRLLANGPDPVPASGPTRAELVSRVCDAAGRSVGPLTVTALPAMLLPDRSVAAIVRIAVPPVEGQYTVRLAVQRAGVPCSRDCVLPLEVSEAIEADRLPPLVPRRYLDSLGAAASARQLPDGYVDVTLGRFALLKRWIKKKLLHNFQTAYVDVIARQQSEFNRQVVNALTELADAQAVLDRAVQSRVADESLRKEIQNLRHRRHRLARELTRLPNAQESHA